MTDLKKDVVVSVLLFAAIVAISVGMTLYLSSCLGDV